MEMCTGCGSRLPVLDGPTHAYMASSPACFDAFNTVLAAEYSSQTLQTVHRFTVDSWAVQHCGNRDDRRAVQSVGLHLARLFVQLHGDKTPQETNRVMLDFSAHKHTLSPLTPPARFTITVDKIAPFAGSPAHIDKVRSWAQATWQDWATSHAYIKDWVNTHSRYGAQAFP